MKGRISLFAAVWVVARRDFLAVLVSRHFLLFLLGPLFPVLVMAMAQGLGNHVEESQAHPRLGIVMQDADAQALVRAHKALEPRFSADLPDITVVAKLRPGERFDIENALSSGHAGVAAILSGPLSAPRLTGSPASLRAWRGSAALLVSTARDALHGQAPRTWPHIDLVATKKSASGTHIGQLATAQGAQTLLFLLTMLLAGMVLSNLVEEKANKIIEVLAAAIPMDAVFMGKLFAMLGVSLVGIAGWASAIGLVALGGHLNFPLPPPAVGWPTMIGLGIAYFMLAYLLLGSVFLTIGSMAATVREVQTLSMPASMLQLVLFFLASFAMTNPGSTGEIAACLFPFSSPYAMLARAAQDPRIWPHLLAIAWQIGWVAVLVRLGAKMFRIKVMKSGPAPVRKRWFRRRSTSGQ